MQTRKLRHHGRHQVIAALAVVDIQDHPTAVAVGLEVLTDAIGSGLRGGRGDDRPARLCQLQRNGLTNASGRARDQCHLWAAVCLAHGLSSVAGLAVSSARECKVCCTVCTWPRSLSEQLSSSGSMRLVKPLSTWPGPHSTKAWMPSVRMA